MKMNAMHQFAMSKFATSQSRDDAMLEEIDMLQGKVKDLSAVLNHHKTLKAENAALKAELEIANRLVVANEAQARRLENELYAAKKDAERYRWLRDHDNDLWITMIEAIKIGGEAMEAAIDKAMEAK